MPILMAPLLFSGLSQAARDVLNSGYVIDVLKLDFITNRNNVEIRVGGTQNLSSNAVFANLDMRSVIKKPNYLIYMAETWDTKNIMTAEVTIDGLLPGVQMSTSGKFDREKLSKDLRVTCEYKNDFVTVNLNSEFKSLKPVIDAFAVVTYNEWLGGISVQYDTKDKVLQSAKFALSYIDKQFTITTTINNNKVFGCSIFQKLSKLVDLGYLVSMSTKKYHSSLATGIKFQVNKDVTLQAKFNNKYQLYLSSNIKLNDDFILTLSSLIDHQFNQSRHKFGIGLTFKL